MPTLWTRRTFLAASAATLAATRLRAATAASLVYVGSTSKGSGEGIHTGTWNSATRTLSNFRLAIQADAAGFLAATILNGQRYLFAGHQAAPKVGALSSFKIAPSGELTLINTITTPDFDMVHTAFHRGCLVSASYGSGKVMSVKVATDGRLSQPVSLIQLSGRGPHPTRQTSTHAHGVCFSPAGKSGKNYVFINDLGTDRINMYRLNSVTAELTPSDPAFFAAAPGSGPRHLAFHPDGKWAYSVNELDSTITQLAWNSNTATLTLVSTTPTLPPGGDVATNRAGEVLFNPSGRFLYSCNRGAPDELLVFAVDPMDGRLTLLQRQPLEGKEARAYSISPDGNSLLVARQFSNDLDIFVRDPKAGDLKPTSTQYPVNNASCVVFI